MPAATPGRPRCMRLTNGERLARRRRPPDRVARRGEPVIPERMRPPSYRSTARAILIVGVLLALIPGIIPMARTDGPLVVAHAWMWTAIIAVIALAPYAAVFVLSSPTQSETHRQVARGIALVTPLAAFIALGLSLLAALYVLALCASTYRMSHAATPRCNNALSSTALTTDFVSAVQPRPPANAASSGSAARDRGASARPAPRPLSDL